jgi:dTDP-4-amino-4,6-dideoxygalactose transaminase
MFGVPFDVERVRRLAQRHSAVLIEDAANALGAKWNGTPVGSLGDVAAFSFHPRKSFTTGEGGAVVATVGKIDAAVRAWRNHGLRATGQGMECVLPGLNYRLSEIAAAIGVVQSAHLSRVVAKRTTLAQRYVERLKQARGCAAQAVSPLAAPSWSSLVIVVDPSIRLRVMAKLDEAGVDSTIASYCIPSQPYYRVKYGTSPDDFPAARRLADGGITLPLHEAMDSADVDYVCDIVEATLEGAPA